MASSALPRCPRHPDSKVWLYGSYGGVKDDHGHRVNQRQRFKCVEGGHTFTELLPRRQTRRRTCDGCDRPLAAHEGPPSPRQCFYAAREIAHALARVGEGMSYRRAGAEVRLRAERGHQHSFTGTLVPSFDSSVVEDWVEVFTPVVSAPFAVSEWPPLLQLDDLPFYIRDPGVRGGKRCAYRVFGALGYDEHDNRLVYRLEAYQSKQPQHWITFLSALQGRPVTIVCDAESGMLSAIRTLWPHTPDEPSPIIFLSHWHLRHALERLLKRYGFENSPLWYELIPAFASARMWQRFVAAGRAIHFPSLHRWLDRPEYCWWLGGYVSREERVTWQLELPHGVIAKTTSGIEQTLRNVGDAFKRRQGAFRNRERTNRLLDLIRLHQNGHANEARYTDLIRDHLIAHGGYGDPRGQILDHGRAHSLWM